MEDLKPMPSMGETVQSYFNAKLIEMAQTQPVFLYSNPNIRNADYYAPRPVMQIDCCAHCGQPLPEDDPDYLTLFKP